MNGEAGFGEDVVGAGLLEMQTTRSVRLIAVMPSRASPLPQLLVLAEVLRQTAVTGGQMIRRGRRHILAADLARAIAAFVPATGM